MLKAKFQLLLLMFLGHPNFQSTAKAFFSQSGVILLPNAVKRKKLEFDWSSLAFISPCHETEDGLEQVLVHGCRVVLADPDLS